MNDKQLRHFILVAQSGSFSKAAEHAYISIPSLKAQMDQLENELGAPLFARTNRGVSLTEPGKVFLSFARETIFNMEAMYKDLNTVSPSSHNVIRIGYNNDGIRDSTYYDALCVYKKLHPRTHVALTAASRFDLEEFDLFLGVCNTDEPLQRRLLCNYPLYCILPSSFPISTKESLTLDDLIGCDVHIPHPAICEYVSPRLTEALFARSIAFQETPYLAPEYMIQCLTQEFVEIIAGSEISLPPSLVQIPLKGFTYSYYIFYTQQALRNPAIPIYLDTLETVYKKYSNAR